MCKTLLFFLSQSTNVKELLLPSQTSADLPSCPLSSAAPVASGWSEDVEPGLTRAQVSFERQ